MDRLLENLGGASVSLTTEELKEIETEAAKIKPAGDRYSEANAKLIDR